MKGSTLCHVVVAFCTGICCGLTNRKVYIEADKNCGQTHMLDSGEIIVIGSQRGPSSDLQAECEIIFTSASPDDQDRVCMEIEDLDFQGNCYASLTLYDVASDSTSRKKELGSFSCHKAPPMEVCSVGRTLKMDLNRGFVSYQRDLVLFLLQVYTKNPDAPLEDRIKEVPGVFHNVDAYIIILIVIAAVVILMLITVIALVTFYVRRKSSRSSRRGGNSASSALPNTQASHPLQTPAPRQELKPSRVGSQEYYPLRPIPQRQYIGQHFPPFSYQAYTDQCWPNKDEGYPSSGLTASAAGTQSTPVSSYYQTYSLHEHPQACHCYSYPSESLQPDNYPTDGYTSERCSGENYERYSGEGYHSDSYVTERYPAQHYSMERFPPHGVLRGYTGYPGITHPLMPGLCYGSNLGYRPGEEDADQSDVSENEDEAGKGKQLCPGLEENNGFSKSKDEDDNNPEYQEIGPPQFKHVTFM
ncbi:uncharacterized protein [Haliotis cracherodii]|uniref:uncharacterized protein n=1 Tax=Haliotis cracherodii TaxID=6455 RepID=UPI0039E8AA4D